MSDSKFNEIFRKDLLEVQGLIYLFIFFHDLAADLICWNTGYAELTQLSWDNMAAIFRTIFSNAFSWISMKISLIFVPKVPVVAIVHRRMYASLCLNEFYKSYLAE